MDIKKQFDISQQERKLAEEKYKQSQLIIEKLENEIRNLRQHYYEKNYVETMKNEYSDAIRMLEAKLTNLKKQYDNERMISSQKDKQIETLIKEKSELEDQCKTLQEDCIKLQQLHRQTKDRYLLLQSNILNSTSVLRYNENKKFHQNFIETEQKKVADLVKKLSGDCSELEKALEVCHEKIEYFQKENFTLNETVSKLLTEKTELNEQKENLIEKVNNLKKENQLLSEETSERLNTEISSIKQDFNKILQNWSTKFEDMVIQNSERKEEPLHLEDDSTSELLFPQTIKSLNRWMTKLYSFLEKERRFQTEISSLQDKIKKYKENISEMNVTINILKQDLLVTQSELHYKTVLLENTKDSTTVNVEVEKYIQSHKVLYNKWKEEISDFISRFKSRIYYLKKCYNKAQRENKKLKLLIENHVNAISKETG